MSIYKLQHNCYEKIFEKTIKQIFSKFKQNSLKRKIEKNLKQTFCKSTLDRNYLKPKLNKKWNRKVSSLTPPSLHFLHHPTFLAVKRIENQIIVWLYRWPFQATFFPWESSTMRSPGSRSIDKRRVGYNNLFLPYSNYYNI